MLIRCPLAQIWMQRKLDARMIVVGLWRYPIASFGGERCASLDIGVDGPFGDRSIVAVRSSDGAVAAPEQMREWAPAPMIAARGVPPEIRLPDGCWLAAHGPDVRDALARHFGFAVELRPARQFNRPDPHGPGVPVRAPRQPLHLLTTRQLADLQAAVPSSDVGVARFRPNILVETTVEEEALLKTLSGTLRADQCALAVVEKTVRCGFPALAQAAFGRDGKIVKEIRKRYDLHFGFGCRVEQPGMLQEGTVLRFG